MRHIQYFKNTSRIISLTIDEDRISKVDIQGPFLGDLWQKNRSIKSPNLYKVSVVLMPICIARIVELNLVRPCNLVVWWLIVLWDSPLILSFFDVVKDPSTPRLIRHQILVRCGGRALIYWEPLVVAFLYFEIARAPLFNYVLGKRVHILLCLRVKSLASYVWLMRPPSIIYIALWRLMVFLSVIKFSLFLQVHKCFETFVLLI